MAWWPGRPAQPVGERRAAEHGVRGGERAVDGRPGRLVGAVGERRRRLEAPPPEPGGDPRRLGRRRPSRPAARASRTRRAPRRGSGATSRWYSAHAVARKRTKPASCTASIAAMPVAAGSPIANRASAASAARIASARPGCSNGGCSADDSISCCGSWPRCRSEAKTGIRRSSSCSSRYCSRHFARCSLPDDVLGSVPGCTSITSRGGRPHTSSVRWWIASRTASSSPASALRLGHDDDASPCPCSPRRRRRSRCRRARRRGRRRPARCPRGTRCGRRR